MKTKHCFITALTIIALLFISITFSYAQTVTYTHDELNRLKQAQNVDGTIIEYCYDSAGNRTQVLSSDVTPPVTAVSPSGGTYSIVQSVALTCNDGAGSGCDNIYYTTNGSTPTTSSSVYSSPVSISITTTFKYFSIDKVGNSEAVKNQTYTINSVDTTPPTGTLAINGGAAFTNSANVTLTLSCSDVNGCSQMKFSNNNTTYSSAEAYATTKAWALTTGAGNKTIYAKFKDPAGNWSSAYSSTILLDTAKPTTMASPSGGTHHTAQSVTLTCNDNTGSGCQKIYYTTNGTTPTTTSPVYSSIINISTTTTLKFFSKDKAGNSEAVKTKNYKMR